MEQNNEILANDFLEWVNKNYETQKQKLKAYCFNKKQPFSEDIYHSTILKVYDKILRKGILDNSDKGIENYCFLSFKMNTNREKLYARNINRDRNITDIEHIYDKYYNDTESSAAEKVQSDLRKDFFALYLLKKVEDEFGDELLHLFQMKFFSKHTYKQIKERTTIPQSRQKILQIRDWLRKNVTKDELDKKYQEFLQKNSL